MDVVRPPWLIDFGKAHLDHRVDFGPDATDLWKAQVSDLFGERAGAVWMIYHTLWRNYRIDYPDLKPGNIKFAGDRY